MMRARAHRSAVTAGIVAVMMVFGAAGCGTTGDTEGAAPSATDAPIGDDTGDAVDEPTVEPTDAPTGEPADDDEPRAPLDACELLTEDDVAEVFGEPVEPGETNGTDECWWYSENQLKTANLLLSQPDLDEWRSGLENDSWEPVDLGDEGYRGVSMFDTVEFRVGDTVLEINVIYSTSGDSEAAVDDLAERVAARA